MLDRSGELPEFQVQEGFTPWQASRFSTKYSILRTKIMFLPYWILIFDTILFMYMLIKRGVQGDMGPTVKDGRESSRITARLWNSAMMW
jgi:hypothetical protein